MRSWVRNGFGVALMLGLWVVPQDGWAEGGRTKTNWYIGLGLGGGGGWLSPKEGPASDLEGGGAALFKVGWVLNPNILLGYESSAWTYFGGDDLTLSFVHNDAMFTYFFSEESGFFLKGGLGVGYVHAAVGSSEAKSDPGFDLRAGLGYEIPLGNTLQLGFEANFASTLYDGGATDDVSLLVTLNWY